MEIKLNIEEQYVTTFLDFIKTLNYVKIQAIKAPVKAKESITEGFQRAAKDQEILDLVEEGLEDYVNLINK